MEHHTRLIEYQVDSCPICQGNHHFTLAVTVSRKEKPPLYFGGKTTQDKAWNVSLTCPSSNRPFVEYARLGIESGEELEDVKPASTAQTPASPLPSPNLQEGPQDWLREELAEGVKTSRDTARNFCTTMITVSTGAIPVYFAVLKYLGRESVSGWWALSVASPLFLLAAATVFALGLRPVLTNLADADEYARAREQRLRTTNRFIVIATLLFLLGILAAIVVWTIVLLS